MSTGRVIGPCALALWRGSRASRELFFGAIAIVPAAPLALLPLVSRRLVEAATGEEEDEEDEGEDGDGESDGHDGGRAARKAVAAARGGEEGGERDRDRETAPRALDDKYEARGLLSVQHDGGGADGDAPKDSGDGVVTGATAAASLEAGDGGIDATPLLAASTTHNDDDDDQRLWAVPGPFRSLFRGGGDKAQAPT